MKFHQIVVLSLLAALPAPSNLKAQDSQPEAAAIYKLSGVKGGFVVHVRCGDGKLTAALRSGEQFQVHGLSVDEDQLQAARTWIQSQDTYGPVAVDRIHSKRLPYIDNLVNLLVIENAEDVLEDEILRVLTPGGVALTRQEDGWRKQVKPWPDNIDEWTHFLHDASGNSVAHDDVVGPPRHLQWLGSPRWSRHHDRMASMSALVSSNGRIFYIMDEGSRISIQLPAKWSLIARDAFNGTVLWKRKIDHWQNHLYPLKSGPTQLARRLVADGDRIFVTLGLQAPLLCLDAITGKTIRTYPESKTTEEVIYSDGTLLAVVTRQPPQLTEFVPKFNVGDQARVRNEIHWNAKPRVVMAINADSGQVLWEKETVVAPLSLATKSDRVLYHDGSRVVCLERASGKELWNSDPAGRREAITFNFGPRLLLYKDIVLFAGGDRMMHAYDLADGTLLWSAPHARSGYESPEDLMVSGGLVWSAPTTRTGDSGTFTGRDPRTGEVKSEFSPNVETYWFHHRCYIAKATDKFLLTSRTGIEFVNPATEDWDIHHWVRGGCLYGIMPCNGLVYAPPHDCACYPETKLYGLNVLAPSSPNRALYDPPEGDQRLVRGPAFGAIKSVQSQPGDWPTFRSDNTRSGFTSVPVENSETTRWEVKLGGHLSSMAIANGLVYIAQIDAHTLHALDEGSGERVWSFTAGGRVDSPPTIFNGQAIFGSADGWVYCLRASDGQLAWKFRAAPTDRRLMAFEQLESVWPVHGNVLVLDGIIYFVAGRSNYLDGGLHFYRLDLENGEVLSKQVIDDKDPETGEDLQDRLQVLNMPVGLPDILSSDGSFVYMRSQRFDLDGERQEVGPVSGQPARQGAAQKGTGVHLFSPTGYLDGSYFHRSYFVYGKNFAGGHGGYYQAGKYAPSGRLIVNDQERVYGFGRKPQYLRWTTTMEHQLFATSKEAPDAPAPSAGGGGMVRVEKSKSIDPTGTALAVEAWAQAGKANGVIVARGGPADGYALIIKGGKPQFILRAKSQMTAVTGADSIAGEWAHLVGVLTSDKELKLYVNGKLAGSRKVPDLIRTDPVQSMEIGADDLGAVGNYTSPYGFTGLIDEVRVYHTALSAEDVTKRFEDPKATIETAKLVFAASFDNDDAQDSSGNENHGKLVGVKPDAGKYGRAIRFTGRRSRTTGSFVKFDWSQDVPLYVRAMVLADKSLFVCGPPDLVDDEVSLEKIMARDTKVQEQLAEQDAALLGSQGAPLMIVSTESGEARLVKQLKHLPVWDGMVAGNGKLFIATTAGTVICLGGEKK
jgi:outer membrane protein assembly factor BamB